MLDFYEQSRTKKVMKSRMMILSCHYGIPISKWLLDLFNEAEKKVTVEKKGELYYIIQKKEVHLKNELNSDVQKQ